MLTGTQKAQRLAPALNSLERYNKDGDEFLNHIMKLRVDETWDLIVYVETKEQPNSGCTHSPNKPKKFKQMFSARKLIAAVFWDRKGVLMIKFMLQGTTVILEVYGEMLKELRKAIQNERLPIE
jgi:hypothetical protein